MSAAVAGVGLFRGRIMLSQSGIVCIGIPLWGGGAGGGSFPATALFPAQWVLANPRSAEGRGGAGGWAGGAVWSGDAGFRTRIGRAGGGGGRVLGFPGRPGVMPGGSGR